MTMETLDTKILWSATSITLEKYWLGRYLSKGLMKECYKWSYYWLLSCFLTSGEWLFHFGLTCELKSHFQVMLLTDYFIQKAPQALIKFWDCSALIREWRWLEGGAYFKVKDMNNIKCQNRVIFSFKIKIKHKFSLLLNQI